MKVHDFQDRLSFSEGVTLEAGVIDAMANMVPNSTGVRRATEEEDRDGTDYWIDRQNLPALSVDVKHREFCPIERFGSDDACVETTSVYKGEKCSKWEDKYRHKIGWSLDPSKRTDYVLFSWPNNGGTRYWILPFPPLCAASRMMWRLWARDYGERPALNDGYITLSVYPPRAKIAHAMKALLSGVA